MISYRYKISKSMLHSPINLPIHKILSKATFVKEAARKIRVSASVSPLCSIVSDVRKKDSTVAYVSSLMFQDEWQKATGIVRSSEKSVRRKLISPYFLKEGKAEILLIHLACSISSVPVHFLESLLFAYPESLQQPDSRGRNCLQIALKSGVSEEVLLFLIRKDPLSASHQDCHGRVPLHYACSNRCPEIVVQELVAACPAAVRADENHGGWTPLHIVAQNCYSVAVARMLLSCSSQTVLMKTRSGFTPLEINKCSPHRTTSQLSISSMLTSEEKRFLHLPLFENFQISKSPLMEACFV